MQLVDALYVLASYDVVGVVPHTEAALERCLARPAVDHIDVIVLPSSSRAAFPLKAALAKRAVRGGIHFELSYSAALCDGAYVLIRNGVFLCEVGVQ